MTHFRLYEILGNAKGTLARAIDEELDMIKNFISILTSDETWLYLDNPEGSEWIKRGDQPSSAAKKDISSKKVMLTVFWGANKIWFVHVLQEGKTITFKTFIDDILEPHHSMILKERPTLERIYIHYDNERVHNSYFTQRFIDDIQFDRIEHPAYSSDLSPYDYYLFGHMKHIIKGNSFKNAKDAVEAAKRILNGTPQTMLIKAFKNWRTRALFVNYNDDYEQKQHTNIQYRDDV
ncbi:MAG: putative mariner transposase [Streblomastix strix]|uniref:Putative mariner transposase n=1 Tax=Streblomastix strix TaxID=222440 RepID=A0A5J4UV92_9EUKA|nr:MAG: putative mariner transposase [Streblomastix strix]